jgi:transposase
VVSDELLAKIRRLYYAEHWKLGTIAAELDVSWQAVRRAINVVLPPKRDRTVPTVTDPYVEFIRATLERHPRLRATRLYEMLRPRGYTGSVVQLRRVVARLRPPRREAFLRLQLLPGEQAQVDWAHFGTLRCGDAERKLSAFVMVLSWSRAIFLEFFLDQTLESFLRGHVRAFDDFGGVPRVLLYDNLKAAVLERMGETIRFHPRLIDLAAHYHFDPRPCRPARGNEKGRVERAIGYVRSSFFAAREFRSLDDLNAQAREWRDQIAHSRRWIENERRSIAEVFAEERSRLLPRPAHPFESDLVREAHSGKTPFVRFDLNDYSIPPECVGKSLTLVASDVLVRLFDGHREVARHPRSWDRHKLVEEPSHIAELLLAKRKAAQSVSPDRLRLAVPDLDPFLAAALDAGESMHRTRRELVRMLDDYGPETLAAAVAAALAQKTPRPSSVRFLLEKDRRARGSRPPSPVSLERRPDLADLVLEPNSLEVYDELTRTPDHDDDPED